MNITIPDCLGENVLGGMPIERSSSGNLQRTNPLFMQIFKKLVN